MFVDIKKLSSSDLDMYLKELNILSVKLPTDFEPHPKQLEFHKAPNKYRLFLGGNRSGKTTSGLIEGLFHATGIYPTWYPNESKIESPNRGRIIISDFTKHFGETLFPKLKEWLPKELIKGYKKNHEGFIVKYFLKNGSTFDICTHEQDDIIFEGWSGHWAWFDEPPPRSKWIGTVRGLMDYSGKAWLTLTPLSEAWIYDQIVKRQDGTVSVTTVDIRENPYIKEKEIVDFEKTLGPEEIEARLHGKFLHLSGTVYKTLDRSVHVKDLDLENRDSVYSQMKKTWFFVLDPHDRRPHCGLWAFMNPQGKIFIAYELHMEGNITELCSHILAFEKVNGIPSGSVYRIGDPNKMETPSAVSGLKLKLEFLVRDSRLNFFTKIDDDIGLGHLAVKESLYYDKNKPIDTFNSPRLYLNSYNQIPHVHDMMEKYGYQEWIGKTRDSKNPRETPKDLNKDFPDCIRYLIMSNPSYGTFTVSDESDFSASTISVTGYR